MNDGVAYDGNGDLQITTNFMIHLHEDELDSLPEESVPWGNFNRYCKIRDLVNKKDGPITLEDSCRIAGAVAANFEVPQSVTPGRTLWHSGTAVRRTEYLKFQLQQPKAAIGSR